MSSPPRTEWRVFPCSPINNGYNHPFFERMQLGEVNKEHFQRDLQNRRLARGDLWGARCAEGRAMREVDSYYRELAVMHDAVMRKQGEEAYSEKMRAEEGESKQKEAKPVSVEKGGFSDREVVDDSEERTAHERGSSGTTTISHRDEEHRDAEASKDKGFGQAEGSG